MERLALFDSAQPSAIETAPAPAKKPAIRTRLDPRVARRREPLGRSTGINERGHVIDAHTVYKLARFGCTKDEAAQFFGMATTSFSARLHREFDLKLAWDRGSAQSKISIRRLQLRHAEEPGDAGVKMTIHMSKHQLGEVETQHIEHGGSETNPIRVKVEREELIGRIVGNRTIEAGSDS